MNNDQQTHKLVWFFGRGASIACGLPWREPWRWRLLFSRNKRIVKIKDALNSEMRKIPLGDNVYSKFLSILENSTKANWKHLFITTNWDYLLQREISNIGFTVLPPWLVSSHVFHLNGSAEPNVFQNNRSAILLETDSYKERKSKLESNQAVNYFIWEKLFVAVGISFRCEIDKSLLIFLKIHEDNLSFGEGKYIIVEPNEKGLCNSCSIFRKNFPRATIIPIQKTFQEWIECGLTELVNYKVIN